MWPLLYNGPSNVDIIKYKTMLDKNDLSNNIYLVKTNAKKYSFPVWSWRSWLNINKILFYCKFQVNNKKFQ